MERYEHLPLPVRRFVSALQSREVTFQMSFEEASWTNSRNRFGDPEFDDQRRRLRDAIAATLLSEPDSKEYQILVQKQ